MVDSEELIGATEHLTLYTRCHLNRCHYNWVQLYFGFTLSLFHQYSIPITVKVELSLSMP